MGKSSSAAAPTPDPLIGQAAMANAQLSKDFLQMSKEQYQEGLKRQDVTDALTGKVVAQQLATQDQANAWAKEDRERTKSVFQPLQDDFIKTANEYDTPEKQAAAAAAAQAEIAKQSQVQGQVAQRNMASMGVNPNSGRFAGVTRAMDTDTALASADAGNNARQMVRDKAIALKGDAINMGNGLASSAAAAYGIGTNAGNSAVGNNQSGNQNFYQNNAARMQGMNNAVGANQSAGGMMNSLYGSQLQGYQAEQQAAGQKSAGMGQVAGMVGGLAIAF